MALIKFLLSGSNGKSPKENLRYREWIETKGRERSDG